MLLDVAGIKAGRPDAIEAMHRACRSCARIGASKVGAQMFVDDIVQEMALHILTRFIHVYDPARDAEPYLIDVATKMGSGMRRKTWREETSGVSEDNVEDSLPCVVDGAEAIDQQIESDEEDARAAIARRELLRRMAERRKRAQVPESVRFTESELAAVEQALAAVLARAGEAGVPSAPLARATHARRTRAARTDAPAWSRMRDWCAKLGIDTDDASWHVQLSEPLGIHRATLWRWRYGKTHPTAAVLDAIDTAVAAMAKARA